MRKNQKVNEWRAILGMFVLIQYVTRAKIVNEWLANGVCHSANCLKTIGYAFWNGGNGQVTFLVCEGGKAVRTAYPHIPSMSRRNG